MRILLPALVLSLIACRSDQRSSAGQSEHAQHDKPAPSSKPDEHAGHEPSQGVPGFAPVEVDQARQQLLGIRTIPVSREKLERSVRTVGIVQTDETRTSHVHVKFEGFIEEIYANYIGRPVKKGQPLFKIFSRDLLAAQQEYLSSRSALSKLPQIPGDPARSAAEQLVKASRDRLRLFDVPDYVLAKIDRTGVAERAITILAPQSGTIIEKQAVQGLAVTPMLHLYVIADLSKVWVMADVYERDLAAVSMGQKASLRLEALPGQVFEGVVSFVSPTVDQSTRTTKVRFEFPNTKGALRPGLYATVEIAGGAGEALVVPSDAVVDTGERKLVFVAEGGGRFVPRSIVTAAAGPGKYEVREGLREGELIAASGQFLLDSESRIRGSRTGGPAHGGH